MSSPYVKVAEYLKTFLPTTRIQVGPLPPSPDTAVTIIPTPGIYSASNIAHPYDKGTFQVMSRGSYQLAEANIQAIYNKLQNKGGLIGGVWFVEIISLQNCYALLEKDALNRIVLVQNYRFEVENKTENRY